MVIRLETAVSRDLKLLFPLFAEKVGAAVAHARLDGHPIEIFEAWRSPQRQDWLYAQGRTQPGSIVTQSHAWQSWHQYGLAVDVAYNVAGQWSWDWDFKVLVPYFQALGLEWLGPHDAGHFQMTRGLTVDQAHSLSVSGGLQRLWIEVSS